MNHLNPASFGLSEHKRNVWSTYPEPELAPEQLLDPAYWANAAGYLRPYDRIEALSEDGSWWAEYLVLEAGHNWARVHLMRTVDLQKSSSEQSPEFKAPPQDYEIKFRGVRLWSVIRKGDSTIMTENKKTKEEAMGWLGEHLKAMKAA